METSPKLSLPQYFLDDLDGGMYYTQGGGRVYGIVTQCGPVVAYRFNDGSRVYTDQINFKTEAKAVKAATKMAVLMRKSSHSIPHMGTFRSMFEAGE